MAFCSVLVCEGAAFACISVGLTNTGRSIEIVYSTPLFLAVSPGKGGGGGFPCFSFIVVVISGYAASILATSASAAALSVVLKGL